MNIPQIFYWNYRWKQHVEEGFLCVHFYLEIYCFFQLLGGRFRRIFFVEGEFRMLSSRTLPRYFLGSIPKEVLFFLAIFSKYLNSLFFLLRWSYKVFAKQISKETSKQVSVMQLQQIYFLLQNFFGMLRWAVEGCQNVIYSKICDVNFDLAQQEDYFLNICSNIIQINGYLVFFGSTFLFH